MSEDYFSPVGFAKEPVEERRHWRGRVFTLLLAIGIAWLAWARVINPPTGTDPAFRQQQQQESQLPGPK